MLLIIVLFSVRLAINKSDTTSAFFVADKIKIKNHIDAAAYAKEVLPMPSNIQRAHAATIAKIDKNHLIAMYFAGSKEGASDVKIYSSIYDIALGTWSDPKVVLDRIALASQSHQYIKKLGNPVVYKQSDRLQLFVVGTSFGGWAVSKIFQLESYDKGAHFHYKDMLSLSPFLNLSTLVRAQPITLKNNEFLLPVYHELEGCYPLALKFDTKGNYQKTIKMNKLDGQLQPSIIATTASDCLAVFRNSNKNNQYLWFARCSNGGKTWSYPQRSNILNLDNSISLFNFNSEIFLVHNQISNNNKRGKLVLSKMDANKNHFRFITTLDEETIENGSVSYPSTLVDEDYVDIVYDKDQKNIIHIRLNKSYLTSIMGKNPIELS